MEALDQLIGVGLTAGLSIGGVWFVVRLLVGFQRDFIARYRTELDENRGSIDRLEAEVDTLVTQLRDCQTERADLRVFARRHGHVYRGEQ